MTSAASAAGDSADDALLDTVLDRFLKDIADGRTPDLSSVLPDRPDLADRVRETWELAQEVAPKRRHEKGTEFPGHEVIRELGRGGMGQVLLARDRKLGRLVALKVLPRRLAEGRARDRFEREARAVARLSHPLIVPVYEMGETDGQPWFTMQYVEGRTLAAAISAVRGRAAPALSGAEFARPERAGPLPAPWTRTWWEAAARAAADVADALEAAHSQGIVHRDVKPSNVILRDDGFALLFDFGLADVEDEATLTQAGFLGTPHYASPEQAAGETESLDAQTDVWSLAATLYEALTLEVPFPGPVPHEILRRIQTWEPEPPSKLNPAVPRDLETVVLQALEKDRSRRTATARDLADDLRAVLAGRGVKSRRAGLLERGMRSVRRGRALTELLVEQQARNAELRSAVLRAERNERLARDREVEAREARERAEAERDRSQRMFRFLSRALESADPSRGHRDVRVAELLTSMVADAETTFGDDARTKAEVLTTIARSLLELGRTDEAREVAERASAVASAAFGPDDATSIAADEVRTDSIRGDAVAAVASRRDLLERLRRVEGPTGPNAIAGLGNLGFDLAMSGDRREGVGLLREALDLAEAHLGESDPRRFSIENNLGSALSREPGGAEQALVVLRASLDRSRRVRGPRSPKTLVLQMNLASALTWSQALPEAEVVLRDCAEAYESVLGPDHEMTLACLHSLSGVLGRQRRPAEALGFQAEVVRRWERSGTRDPARYGGALAMQSRHLLDLRRFAEAEASARAALGVLVAVPGVEPRLVEHAWYFLVDSLAAQGEAAAGRLEAAIEGAVARLGPASRDVLRNRIARMRPA